MLGAPRVLASQARCVLIFLVLGCGDRMVISDYGSTIGSKPLNDRGEVQHRSGAHAGVDIRAKLGQHVLASAPGVVVSVSRDDDAGVAVLVRHSRRRFVLYLHLAASFVVAFDVIERGQRIGTVGLFPYSGGVPHVHLEVCTDYCPRGHASGVLRGTVRPIFAGCFSRSRAQDFRDNELTYPVLCP